MARARGLDELVLFLHENIKFLRVEIWSLFEGQNISSLFGINEAAKPTHCHHTQTAPATYIEQSDDHSS